MNYTLHSFIIIISFLIVLAKSMGQNETKDNATMHWLYDMHVIQVMICQVMIVSKPISCLLWTWPCLETRPYPLYTMQIKGLINLVYLQDSKPGTPQNSRGRYFIGQHHSSCNMRDKNDVRTLNLHRDNFGEKFSASYYFCHVTYIFISLNFELICLYV